MRPCERILRTHQRALTPGRIIWIGDSRTIAGQVDVPPGTEFRTLSIPSIKGTLTATNLAVGGRYLDNPANQTDMLGDSTNVLPGLVVTDARFGFGSDVHTVVHLLGGINDWLTGGADGAELIARATDVLTAINTAIGAGGRVVVLKEFGINEPDKSTLNDWLVTQVGTLIDVLVETPAAFNDRSNAAVYNAAEAAGGNGIHPNQAGHALLTGVVAEGINTAIGLP